MFIAAFGGFLTKPSTFSHTLSWLLPKSAKPLLWKKMPHLWKRDTSASSHSGVKKQEAKKTADEIYDTADTPEWSAQPIQISAKATPWLTSLDRSMKRQASGTLILPTQYDLAVLRAPSKYTVISLVSSLNAQSRSLYVERPY